MKALAKRLLDRFFAYFVSRYLQPELDLIKAQQSGFAEELGEAARARTAEPSPVSPPPADARVPDGSLRLDLPTTGLSLVAGERVMLSTTVRNAGPSAPNLSVEVKEPFGFGVLATPVTPMPFELGSGEQKEVNWEIVAQRPSEVNLGHPWRLEFVVRSASEERGRTDLSVEVADPEPGRIYYVLTEDCETFDGGELTGDYSALPEL
ncbi:MAG: hypothetical protein JSV65_18775, partial [Armatimonadota bacterium]